MWILPVWKRGDVGTRTHRVEAVVASREGTRRNTNTPTGTSEENSPSEIFFPFTGKTTPESALLLTFVTDLREGKVLRKVGRLEV